MDFFAHEIWYPGLMNDKTREQLILQSVGSRNTGEGLAPQQSQFWMPDSQRQLPPQHSYTQTLTSLAGKSSSVAKSVSSQVTNG